MSTGYVLGLALVVVVGVGLRVLVPAPPWRAVATRVTVTDAVLVALGSLGLAFHCGAMFFPAVFQHLPGTHTVIDRINAMGTASILWYGVAAALVVSGLRRHHPVVVGLVVLALVAVGVTMYDGGPLTTHLVTIFLSVVVLVGVVTAVTLPPRRRTVATVSTVES
jgi:hypothetical protein